MFLQSSHVSYLLFSVIPQITIPTVFFFNATAPTEIYTLSLHDALPICPCCRQLRWRRLRWQNRDSCCSRSEEHTSELQSPYDLVCRLLLEKKKRILISSHPSSSLVEYRADSSMKHKANN